eukprot:5216482-Alexandrium_andersonii.AAC.1
MTHRAPMLLRTGTCGPSGGARRPRSREAATPPLGEGPGGSSARSQRRAWPAGERSRRTHPIAQR